MLTASEYGFDPGLLGPKGMLGLTPLNVFWTIPPVSLVSWDSRAKWLSAIINDDSSPPALIGVVVVLCLWYP